MLLAARRSAINASTEAQQQVFSLVIAAPEPIRARFRGQKLAAMLNTAANLRVHSSWDIETTSTVVALRSLARRAHAMLKEAREHQKAIVTIIRSWRPDLLEEFGVGPIVAAKVLSAWSHPGRIHSEAAFAMLAGVAPIPANSGQVTTSPFPLPMLEQARQHEDGISARNARWNEHRWSRRESWNHDEAPMLPRDF